MKKFLAMGVLALGVAALAQQPASAWVNTKFGAGINWAYQSGGNNVLWGAFRNGQPPAPEGCATGGGHYGFEGVPQGAPMTPPVIHPPATVPQAPQANDSQVWYQYRQQQRYQTVTYPNYYPAYYYPANWYGR